MRRRKSDYKDSKETKLSSINKVSKDNVEHNSVVDKSDIHYDGKEDEEEKEYSNGGEGDDGGTKGECLF